ncbi:MAG TPA: helix-turn-helix domain-containing protein [Candidatus Thalassarchaeaceae archaeon]|nr:helix-turn-helix domain-containing protein [Candidatus Thalassarchaeaceae archaeon]
MGTCELCGNEGTTTRKATVRGVLLECCSKCIDSMGLVVQHLPPIIPEVTAPISRVVGKGISGIDIMSRESSELAPDFHNRIRAARREKGWTQSNLAKTLNLKVGDIQKAENGNRPTDSIIDKISKALGVTLIVESFPSNSKMVESTVHKEMTISDASKEPISEERERKTKKKSRRLGVSRSGARNRR